MRLAVNALIPNSEPLPLFMPRVVWLQLGSPHVQPLPVYGNRFDWVVALFRVE